MPTRNEVARRIAVLHFGIDSGIRKIFRLVAGNESDDNLDEPVKLLEVNEDTIPSGILPLYFRARPERGIYYPSLIVEITPDEFQELGAGLTLPDGWERADEYARPELNQGQTA